jgi:hypothetical protein
MKVGKTRKWLMGNAGEMLRKAFIAYGREDGVSGERPMMVLLDPKSGKTVQVVNLVEPGEEDWMGREDARTSALEAVLMTAAMTCSIGTEDAWRAWNLELTGAEREAIVAEFVLDVSPDGEPARKAFRQSLPGVARRLAERAIGAGMDRESVLRAMIDGLDAAVTDSVLSS